MAWTDRRMFDEGHTTSMSPQMSGLQRMMMEREMETSDQLFNLFAEMAPAAGNSADFQRTLYESFTGQVPPEHYTGFHSGQVGRIQNVIDPEQFDIETMEQIAILSSLFREMQEQGGFREMPGVARRFE